MTTRIDLGVASYQNPAKLDRALTKLRKHTKLDWRCLVVDNASPDEKVRQVIARHASEDPRIHFEFRADNRGYAGAVNRILEWAETQYVGYIDNDAYVTDGWDYRLVELLGRHHELAMVFPNGGAWPIERPEYTEILWGVGFCWILERQRYVEIGGFDETLGHQDEVDFQTRLRLAGWRMAAITDLRVEHDATSTTNPDAEERIRNGIINWLNKWTKYFGGEHLHYFHPQVIRFEDWNVNAVYLEEYWKLNGLAGLNENAERVAIGGVERDLIKVPRWPDLYKGRII